MKKYTLKVGEVFTEQKSKELIEYLEARDEDEVANKSFNELVIWIAEYSYYYANPESKMDVPSIVYEQVEKDFGKFIKGTDKI